MPTEPIAGPIGLLFFMFFLVAIATEALLELLRRPLERLKITPPKPKMSLDDALKLSEEFVPQGYRTIAKLEAVKAFLDNSTKALKSKQSSIDALIAELRNAPVAAQHGISAESMIRLFADINESLNESENSRIRILRFVSFLVALGICIATGTDVFGVLAQAEPALTEALLPHLIDENTKSVDTWARWLGTVLTAAAASSGSSYWHDQLDKVRKLKQAETSIRQFAQR